MSYQFNPFTGKLDIAGSTTPGGSDTQVQYNNAGAFGGVTGATTNGTELTLNAPALTTSLTANYATASTIAIFDASKNLITASTATYPSLTELSYVKGVTSAIQTQLNGKQATLTPAALTKSDDTNVTLTLGGTPATALLQATSLTLGWTGTLAVARGGTGTGSAGITAFNNITGYSAAGATGTTSTNLVFSTSPSITTPTFVTSATVPKIIGGSGTTGTQLTLQTTSGNGTTDAMVITGGNNGATTFATFSNNVANFGTSAVVTGGTFEIGAASDTTLSRSSAGVLAVEGVVIDTVSAANTLTNKTMSADTYSGASTLSANGYFNMAPATSDGVTGPATNSFNSGYSSTAVGDLVYLDSSATWQGADADLSATSYSSMLGIALEVKASGAAVLVALPGSFVRVSGWSWTVGGKIYMSTTAKALTQTQPVATDNASRIIGYAVASDKMYFYPSQDYVVHT